MRRRASFHKLRAGLRLSIFRGDTHHGGKCHDDDGGGDGDFQIRVAEEEKDGSAHHRLFDRLAAADDEDSDTGHADALDGKREIPAEHGALFEKQYKYGEADGAAAHGCGAGGVGAYRHG